MQRNFRLNAEHPPFTLQSLNTSLLGVLTCLLMSGCIGISSKASAGTPASWDAQIALVVQAAQKVDKTARMINITAFPTEFHTPNWDYSSSPLRIEFDFDRAGGNDLKITFADTNITDTLKVEEWAFSTWAVSSHKGAPQSVETILAAVKLSPREAGLLTWEDAKIQASKRQIQISPTFWAEPLKPHVVWNITYDASSRKMFELGYDLKYIVDAKTGEILERDYTPTYP